MRRLFKLNDKVKVCGCICIGKEDYSYDVDVDTVGIVQYDQSKCENGVWVILNEADGTENVHVYVDNDIMELLSE